MLTKFNKVNYVSRETIIGAENLNNIQDSVLDNAEKVENLNTEVESINSRLEQNTNRVESVESRIESELHSHSNKTVLDNITSAKVTEWNNKSTFSGSYNDLSNKPTIPSIVGLASETYVNEYVENAIKDIPKEEIDLSGYVTKDEVPTKVSQLTNDKGYITSIPSEYITETELNSLTLGVHTDGMIYLFKNGQPIGNGVTQSTQSGDVVGYVDSENNIVLSGKLADGTYKLKYEMEDGSKIDVGQIDLSDKPAYTNQIPLSIASDGTPFNGGQGWKTGYRISSSSGGEAALEGTECTGFIPVTNKSKIRIKGIALPSVLTDPNYTVVGYDKNFAKLESNGVLIGTLMDTTDDNGVTTFKDFSNFTHFSYNALAYIRLCSSNIDENSILTVDEPIV